MQDYYALEAVNHYFGDYVRDKVTTNHVEDPFGHFHRAVQGVYHKVSDEHKEHKERIAPESTRQKQIDSFSLRLRCFFGPLF